MSKRTTTGWYGGAWIVYVLALIAALVTARSNEGISSPPAALYLEYLVMMGTAIVMLVMWIGALVSLGMQQAWGRFVAVLVLHIVGLGMVGMSAYTISSPEDLKMVVIRPSTPISQAWS